MWNSVSLSLLYNEFGREDFISMFLLVLQGFKSQALAVSCDPEHKFELAIQLGELKSAYQLAQENEVRSNLF